MQQEWYVALSKRCEQPVTVRAEDRETAIMIAKTVAGGYDEWTVDEAYVVKHRATDGSKDAQAA